MKHLGDISKINGSDIEPVDIITFGSPCQDLSVAGKRAGLDGARSGLFMEAVRIIKEMREATNGQYPRYALWENVPGAFSSNKGEDFRVVLEELIKIAEPSANMPEVPPFGWAYADSYVGDGWSLAYRVFDTQYWPRTPQRRRRIYLVADFGGQRAREILFERKGLRGHLTESPAPRERVTAYVEVGPGTADFEPTYAVATQQGGAEISENGVCPTVTAAAGMSGNNQPWLCYPDVAQTLSARHDGSPQPDKGNGSNIVAVSAAFKAGQGVNARGVGWEEEKCPTLASEAGVNSVPSVCVKTWDARGNGDGETVKTITGDHENRIADYSSVVVEPIPIHDQATRFSGKHGEKHDGKGNGLGIGNPGDPMNTLTGGDRHAVAYPEAESKAQLASGANVAGCLMASGYDKLGAQEMFSGDYTVIETHPAVTVHGEEISGTLLSRDYKGAGRWDSLDKVVCCPNEEDPIALDRAFYNQGQNAQYSPQYYTDGTVPTLVAKGPAAVCAKYIVRRLTPTECARLQGFPDTWGHPDKKDSLSDEEYQFWQEVRNTHAAINGKAVKDYTKAQMEKWYNKLHSDSAEYKMWGNGIALPPSLYCMQGIEEALKNEDIYEEEM